MFISFFNLKIFDFFSNFSPVTDSAHIKLIVNSYTQLIVLSNKLIMEEFHLGGIVCLMRN